MRSHGRLIPSAAVVRPLQGGASSPQRPLSLAFSANVSYKEQYSLNQW
jgi:hypothetical protein